MARPISWLHRLPDIRKAVGGSSSSHFDRGDIGNLFQVQKSKAGKLMGLMPRSGKLGSSHLVEKIELLNFLKGAHEAKDLPAYLEKLKRDGPRVYRRRRVHLSKRDDGLYQPTNPLRPGAIAWSRGRIEILGSASAEEAIETMLWAGLTVLADRDAFERDYCVEKPAGLARLAGALDGPAERERRREYLAWCEKYYGKPLFGRDPEGDGDPEGESSSGTQIGGMGNGLVAGSNGTPRKASDETGVDTGGFEVAQSPSLSATHFPSPCKSIRFRPKPFLVKGLSGREPL